MRIADKTNRKLVLDILCSSFDDNKSINFIVKQDAKRRNRLRNLMKYSFDRCVKTGKIYISDDEKACALVFFSELKASSVYQNVLLVLNCIGLSNMLKVIKREKQLKSHHPSTPFYQLWFIGVFQEYQKKGIGSKILGEVLKKCDQQKLPVYLETSVLSNVSWYKNYGFEVFNEIKNGFKLFQMIRD